MNFVRNRWTLLTLPPTFSFELLVILDGEALSPSLLHFLFSEIEKTYPHAVTPVSLQDLLRSPLLQKRYLLANARILLSPAELPSFLKPPELSLSLGASLSPQQIFHEIAAQIERLLPSSLPSLQGPWRLPPLAVPPASAHRSLPVSSAVVASPFLPLAPTSNAFDQDESTNVFLTASPSEEPFLDPDRTFAAQASPPSPRLTPRFTPPTSSLLPWILGVLLVFVTALALPRVASLFFAPLPKARPPASSPSSSSPPSSLPVAPPFATLPAARTLVPPSPPSNSLPPAPPRMKEPDPPSQAFHPSWIGGLCRSLEECPFSQSMCLRGILGGACTAFCTSFCPPPPKTLRGPASALACVPSSLVSRVFSSFPEINTGLCLPLCDYERFPLSGCRTGFSCQMHSLYRSKRRKTVCVPWP